MMKQASMAVMLGFAAAAGATNPLAQKGFDGATLVGHRQGWCMSAPLPGSETAAHYPSSACEDNPDCEG